MKKVFGYVLKGFGVFIFLLVLIAIGTQYLENSGQTNATLWLVWIISVAIPILLYLLGRYLIKKSREPQINSTLRPREIFFDRTIEINGKLTFKEYWKGLSDSFVILKNIFFLLPLVGVIQFLVPLLLDKKGVGIEGNASFPSFEYFEDHTTAIFFILLPIVIFLVFKLSFKTSSFKQNLFYQFQGNSVLVKGNDFESKLDLNSIEKVRLTKSQILIFFTKGVSNVIPNRFFESASEYNYFIEVLKKGS